MKGGQRVLKLKIEHGPELWDEENEVFTRDGTVLELEHSLVTLSKWEEIYGRPFLGEQKMSGEEVETYIRLMVQTPDYDPDLLHMLSQKNVDDIQEYIQKEHSATTFAGIDEGARNREIITNELIYYWMNTLGVDKEYERWHLNRLFTLIKVHSVKNGKPKKKAPADLAADRRRLNAERKAKYGTSG